MQNKKKTGLDVFSEFNKSIESNAFPMYYICGEEVFFHDLAIKRFTELIPKDLRDFNYNLVHGQDSTVDQVLGLCRSYPMMAEKRVVIVRDFQLLAKSSADNGNLNDFLNLVDKPNPTALVLFVDEKPIAKTTKIGKAIAQSNSIGYFEFASTPDYLLADWVSNWTNKTHQIEIEPQAAQLLVQFIGDDLLLLSKEIEKLATARFQEKKITEKDIRDLVGFSKEFTIFELKDAIVQRRTPQAMNIGDHIIGQGDGPVGEILKCLGFFNMMYMNIWQYLRMQAKGLSPDMMSEALNMRGYRFTMLQKEARLYSISSMPQVFEILYDTDRAIKGFSTLDEKSIFYFMIKRLCSI